MIIKTEICVDHLALINVFIDANELHGVNVNIVETTINNKKYHVLQLESTNEDTTMKLSYMALIHSGITNMLDDFLLKCGVLVNDIPPHTNRNQLVRERMQQIQEIEDGIFQGMH